MSRVRVAHTVELTANELRAFCRYNDLDPRARRRALDLVRSVVMDVGTMGLAEQVHDGQNRLAADDMPDPRTAPYNRGTE